MNRAFFLNSEMQIESLSQTPWKPMIPTFDGIFRPNWEKSDQYSQFDSALSSLVSSPVSSSTVSNDIVAARELAGKLGGEFSSSAKNVLAPYSDTNAPLSSSMVSSPVYRLQNSMSLNTNLPPFGADPGFVERAAKFSSFGNRSFNDRDTHMGLNSNKPEIPIGSKVSPVTGTGKYRRVSSSPAIKVDRPHESGETNMKLSKLSCSAATSNEESSVSEQIPLRERVFRNQKDSNSRKRKGGSLKGVGSNTKKEEEDKIDESKRLKKTEQENGGKTAEKLKPAEPPKDYIHVRARRGQATDSHSLAERVRREKISERMKLLQNLVPNCNKVTGKALMLDEIINYVQSLQRQVEFLSMKLATVNPSLDFDTNDFTSQNVNQSNGHLSHQTSTLYPQNPQLVFNGSAPVIQPVHEFTEPFPHGFGVDDLECIFRMGFGENLDDATSFFHMTHDQTSMKMEL
ncbi:hypothetical protein R6Q57_004544 [Mikania cordata]